MQQQKENTKFISHIFLHSNLICWFVLPPRVANWNRHESAYRKKKHTKTIALQWWGRHNSPSFKFFCEASPRFTLTKPACYAASNPLLFDGTLAMQGFTCETDGPQNNCLTANPKPELIMTWFAIIAIRCCRRFDAIFLTTRLTLMGLKWGFALDFLCTLVRIENYTTNSLKWLLQIQKRLSGWNWIGFT